jgi:AraC family transcriptional regulator of adaptative response / DNA-3-methyladenine glycosylase II
MDRKPDTYFKNIIARRDPRYDGRFYFGVKTTGIYCRPICPAKPKPENILIFRSPSEAERAGYRPCLRCHPDLAPGMKRVSEAERLVSRALRVIQASPLENLTIQTLADELQVTDRHVRRLFEQYLGASPIEIMITQRLHLAKQMIQETSAPLTEIAFAVGFQSIRRFNEAFKDGYHSSPSSLRKEGESPQKGPWSLKIPIRLPYDWEQVMAYLKRHETYGLEHVEAHRYRRFIPKGKKFGVLIVSPALQRDYLTAEFLDIPLREIRFLLARVKNLFDTDHNPLHLPRSGKRRGAGIRVPGSFDPFETAISIILSQLVSTEQAKQTLKKLVCRYGRLIGHHETLEVFEFPQPRALAQAHVQAIGLPRARARAIRELSRGVSDGSIDFTAQGGLTEMKERLLRIHGIGPWTATMIAMRCLNDGDAFPESDLVIEKVVKKNLVDPAAWTSSRAYLTHIVWREYGRQKENEDELRL